MLRASSGHYNAWNLATNRGIGKSKGGFVSVREAYTTSESNIYTDGRNEVLTPRAEAVTISEPIQRDAAPIRPFEDVGPHIFYVDGKYFIVYIVKG